VLSSVLETISILRQLPQYKYIDHCISDLLQHLYFRARMACLQSPHPSTLITAQSQNTNRIRRTRHPTGEIQRRTRKKETPAPTPRTHLRQLLQIEHLPNRHAPHGQKDIMQPKSLVLCRPRLKDIRISTHSSEVMVPEPLHRRLRAFDPGPRFPVGRASFALRV